MIYVYILPVISVGKTDTIAGAEHIHDAILDTTPDPNLRKLYMEPTSYEHLRLSALATEWSQASPVEVEYFEENVERYTPSPDLIRARELLATSPAAISQPEIWELLRIFGRLLGISS